MSATPPPLDDLVGEWMTARELAHLFSLRNQWGQAHVNSDLTSLSWLAIPPFSGGYHTGVLRVNGTVPAAERFRWSPWGVEREASVGALVVHSDTRLAFEANRILWNIRVTNGAATPATVELRQELLAPIAHSEVDWGWLYGSPWNAGHYHDHYATERIRAEVVAEAPRQVQLLPHDARPIRLGRPRIPGIQRDEVTEAMLLDSALPNHTTPDVERASSRAVIGVVSALTVTQPTGSVQEIPGRHRLVDAGSELRLDVVSLDDGTAISFDLELDQVDQTGVLLTHGNHPDSLQLGLESGRPWLAIGGERVAADNVLGKGSHEIAVTVTSNGAWLLVDGASVASTDQWWLGQRWVSRVEGDSLLTIDSKSPAVSSFALTPQPQSIVAGGSRGEAVWSLALQPGESASVSFVLDIGTDPLSVRATATALATDFSANFAAIADRWRELWSNAFIPGNSDHSGYLPVLNAKDSDLARTYYLGILLALYMRNTGVSDIGPVFLTGGPRLGPTTTFYWDISEWARIAALLEPTGLRAWILAALDQPYETSHSFDTRNLLPVGNHYAANDHALFRTIQAYVGITGDLAILDEFTRGMTVLDHLRGFAFRPRTQRARFGDGVLVDLGHDAWELLECVPNYRDVVVSFNAGYVGMLRALADLLELRGERAEAELARSDASELAGAVIGQYAGDGRWRISHPGADDVIGHCLDFELVAADMSEDLDERTRNEMVTFVETHLIDGDWMRALSPDDPIAPYSDRPDHGAAGAFAGWPGSTSYGLSRLGRSDLAAKFLGRVHRSRSGALWGQAVEAIGSGRYSVAERGVSNRDSNAAVAVSEAVLAGLFGIRADFEHLGSPVGEVGGEFGTLTGVRAIGFDLTTPVLAQQVDEVIVP